MGLRDRFSPTALQVLSLMVFWGQIQNYMMRTNLAILIVAMTKDPAPPDTGDGAAFGGGGGNATAFATDKYGYEIRERCPATDNVLSNISGVNTDSPNNNGYFAWDEFDVGIVLSAFSYGYLCTQIVGGRLTERFGFKRVYGLGLLLTAVLTLVSPIVAYRHMYAFVVLRALQGLCEGVTFPALHGMTARWVPREKRSRFIARSYFGTTFGSIITFPLCGYFIDAFGWESAFHAIGVLTFAWFMFWCVFVFDLPEKHPRISLDELEELKEGTRVESRGVMKRHPVPWAKIMTSRPFVALIVADASNTCGLIMLGSYGPSYLKYMLGVDMKTNGILSGLPWLCRYFGGVFHSLLADALVTRQYVSVANVRRVFNTISQVAPAVTMALVVYVGCDVIPVIVLLCVGMFFNGSIASGHFSNHVDLSPNFAGTLLGVSNTFASGIVGSVTPIAVGAVIQDNMTFDAWKVIFWGTAAFYFTGNVVYVLFLSGDVQEWNYPEGVSPPSAAEEGTTEEKKALHRMEERRASIQAFMDARRGSSVRSQTGRP